MSEDVQNINAFKSVTGVLDAGKRRVVSAIKTASDRTGVDFSYLLGKAVQESSLNPSAKASTSSATGLYQFIEQTWLRTVKQNGADYGLSPMADKIKVGADGIARVESIVDKNAILALRNNPEISAYMAAELAKTNQTSLENRLGKDVGATELYMAHFLGAGGAGKFLSALQNNPDARAADLLPRAANANRSVFFDRSTGQPRTVAQVYGMFANKFKSVTPPRGSEVQLAAKVEPVATGAIAPQDLVAWQPSAMASFRGDKSSVTPTGNSPFTTMLLAQMDMKSFGLDAAMDVVGKVGLYDMAQRRTALSALASTA